MSVEEDTELRDLVSQTLENNGVLAKIRAELRASVFLALEEQETNLSKAPFENKALKEYLKSSQAALGLCVVREFLEYLELDFTLSVYNTETSHGKGYEYSGRNKLVKDLQIRSLNGKKGPLLAHILQIAQESCGISAVVKEEAPLTIADNIKLSPVGSPFLNASLENSVNAGSPTVPMDRTFTADGATVKGLLLMSTPTNGDDAKLNLFEAHQEFSPSDPGVTLQQKQDSKSKESVLSQAIISNCEGVKSSKAVTLKDVGQISTEINDSDAEDRKQSLPASHLQTQHVNAARQNPMTSLNELPPIDGVQRKKTSNHVSNINFADLDLPEDYEEDFVSSESSAAAEGSSKSCSENQKSGKYTKEAQRKDKLTIKKSIVESVEKETSEKAPNSPIASISEDIEENTNSGVDDLLNSTASMENTVDATISHIQSNFADHIEEL